LDRLRDELNRIKIGDEEGEETKSNPSSSSSSTTNSSPPSSLFGLGWIYSMLGSSSQTNKKKKTLLKDKILHV